MGKVAVVLAGCGVFDGAEIHESVLTLLRLSEKGVAYQCLAPNIEQMHVVNHLTGEVVVGEVRNVLVEAARIARGETELRCTRQHGASLTVNSLNRGLPPPRKLCCLTRGGRSGPEVHHSIPFHIDANRRQSKWRSATRCACPGTS